MGRGTAFRLLEGAAWGYAQEARGQTLDDSDYADIHGLDRQRYYNLLCLAYGSDRAYFGDVVRRAGLPKERVERCATEYRQASHALQRLIAPSLDSKQLRRALWKHRIKSHWHHQSTAERLKRKSSSGTAYQQSLLSPETAGPLVP